MLRRIPGLRVLVERRQMERRLERLAREAPARSAAEHAEAVRRILEQARAEQ
jgi:hypothetical protein